jgi:hypothetical protein
MATSADPTSQADAARLAASPPAAADTESRTVTTCDGEVSLQELPQLVAD